tara:strand:- start:106 stop:759 length:654 start_codon:yes stop_codon:yes gene_type:complete
MIYKIYCKDQNIKDVYVGSTTNFKRRKCMHKSSVINEKNKKNDIKVYKFIRDNGGWENWDMEWVADVQCAHKLELLKIEGQYIKLLNGTLNIRIAGRTTEEYYNDNKDKIVKQMKEYAEQNKEELQEYAKEYYNDNKDKLVKQMKEYAEQNKGKLKEYAKEYNKKYHEKNKEKRKEKRKEKITCECGSTTTKGHITSHLKTKKHIKYLNDLKGNEII